MNSRKSVCSLLLLAVAAVPAMAQTVPYQSSQRSQYGNVLSDGTLPKGGTFLFRVDAAVQYADNLALTDDPDLQVSSGGLELSPGFYASYSSDSFQGAIDYSLIGRAWEESDFDDVTHRLAANGRWTAVADLFYVDGTAAYFDSVIDPRAGMNPGNAGLLGTDNLAETATTTLTPTLRKRFNEFEFLAMYSYGRVWYIDTPDSTTTIDNDFEDSTDQFARTAFGTAETDRKLTGQVFYEWSKSEFEVSPDYRYDRLGFDGGWQFADTLTLVGDVGVESALDEDTSSGGLDDEFWSAGLRWLPGANTSAEARFGQRFFGDSYYAAVTRRAKLVLMELSYREEPTVESLRVGSSEVVPGQLPPSSPGTDPGRVSSDPFVAKDARFALTAEGAKTGIRMTVYDTERDYLSGTIADETTIGGRLGATRQFAANLSGDLEASYEDTETESLGAGPLQGQNNTYQTEALLRLNHRTSRTITTSLEGGYFNQSGTLAYDGWWVALRARYQP
jgi:uncharacterized protein (PEP-CTERM system associated)